MPINPEDFPRHASGLVGALTATLWIKDTWPRRIAYVFAGAAASHYFSPTISIWTGADLSLAGFLVGLFGMATCAKLYETLEAINPKDVAERVLKKIGL